MFQFDSLTARKILRAALIGFALAAGPAVAAVVEDGFQGADLAAIYVAAGVGLAAAIRAVLVVLPVNDD